MNSLLFPSKLVGERITITFPFQDELGWGETILSAVVFAEVYSGTDLDPELLIYQVPTFTNGVDVRQRIRLGVPGVIYRVSCRIVGNAGTEAEKGGFLAVLPGTGITPLFAATYFTSFIYPAVGAEAVIYTAEPRASSLTRLIVRTSAREAVVYSASVRSSTLGALLIQTSVREKVLYTPSILTSTLDVILKTTAMLEKVIYTPAIVSSTLDTILIRTNVAEKVIYTPSIISSTLTTI